MQIRKGANSLVVFLAGFWGLASGYLVFFEEVPVGFSLR